MGGPHLKSNRVTSEHTNRLYNVVASVYTARNADEVRKIVESYQKPAAHSCRYFYVSIDDGKYLEKCVLCDEPKV
jgi:hypothetical protein